MPIEYSAIARGSVILVSYQSGDGRYEFMSESVLQNIPTDINTKISYASDDYLIHVVVDNEIIYLCIGNADFGKRLPYAFLEEIRSRFTQSTLATRAITARYRELDRDFEYILKQEMEKYSSGEAGDNLSQLRSQVNDVKNVMIQNVDKILERGENLEILRSKTEDLEASANMFQGHARKVHRKMRCQNIKFWIIGTSIVVVIITVIVLFASGVFNSKDDK